MVMYWPNECLDNVLDFEDLHACVPYLQIRSTQLLINDSSKYFFEIFYNGWK